MIDEQYLNRKLAVQEIVERILKENSMANGYRRVTSGHIASIISLSLVVLLEWELGGIIRRIN